MSASKAVGWGALLAVGFLFVGAPAYLRQQSAPPEGLSSYLRFRLAGHESRMIFLNPTALNQLSGPPERQTLYKNLWRNPGDTSLVQNSLSVAFCHPGQMRQDFGMTEKPESVALSVTGAGRPSQSWEVACFKP